MSLHAICQSPEECHYGVHAYVKRGRMEFVGVCRKHRLAFDALEWPEQEVWRGQRTYVRHPSKRKVPAC